MYVKGSWGFPRVFFFLLDKIKIARNKEAMWGHGELNSVTF